MSSPSSHKPSYSTRFRGFVEYLSIKHEAFLDPKTKKRNYEDTFGPRVYDQERYGQEIAVDFFQQNVGHGVTQ